MHYRFSIICILWERGGRLYFIHPTSNVFAYVFMPLVVFADNKNIGVLCVCHIVREAFIAIYECDNIVKYMMLNNKN